jgi:copper chaperone CopZ
VEKGLGNLENVSMVKADPDLDRVIVQADKLSDEDVKSAVERLGYIYKGRF